MSTVLHEDAEALGVPLKQVMREHYDMAELYENARLKRREKRPDSGRES